MKAHKRIILLFFLFATYRQVAFGWGFFAHQKLNRLAVFLLPPGMLICYKPNLAFIAEHAVDPDKRRYGVAAEAPRHYIDIDHYGFYPYDALPRKWENAEAKFSGDTLQAHGIVPWYIQTMLSRLTKAFKEKNFARIMKYSAEIGHYIADAHVPLHTSSNHNGQLTGQQGIHAFWESRVPELLADKEFDFFIGKAMYIKDPSDFIWQRILESAKAADSVLTFEKELSKKMPSDKKYAFEERNGVLVRQYSSAYTIAYNKNLNGMVERRMRLAIFSIASCWYTAWVNAGQPDLKSLADKQFSEGDMKEFEVLNQAWKKNEALGRKEE